MGKWEGTVDGESPRKAELNFLVPSSRALARTHGLLTYSIAALDVTSFINARFIWLASDLLAFLTASMQGFRPPSGWPGLGQATDPSSEQEQAGVSQARRSPSECQAIFRRRSSVWVMLMGEIACIPSCFNCLHSRARRWDGNFSYFRMAARHLHRSRECFLICEL